MKGLSVSHRQNWSRMCASPGTPPWQLSATYEDGYRFTYMGWSISHHSIRMGQIYAEDKHLPLADLATQKKEEEGDHRYDMHVRAISHPCVHVDQVPWCVSYSALIVQLCATCMGDSTLCQFLEMLWSNAHSAAATLKCMR